MCVCVEIKKKTKNKSMMFFLKRNKTCIEIKGKTGRYRLTRRRKEKSNKYAYILCVFVWRNKTKKREYICMYIYICHQGEDKSCLKHAKKN